MDLRALIFVPALVGSTILGFVFLLFAANYYLTVLEGTAAGAREVPWTSEPVTDNFTKVFYLGWLLGLWAGPAYLIGRAATAGAGADAGWVRLAVPLLVMWALYPVSQLASLSASSVWVPLSPQVFARLAQKPLVTAGFYLLTLPVVAAFGVGFKWAFLTAGQHDLLFAGVPLVALTVLLYGRLLGRLAFALTFTKDLFKRKKKKTPKPDAFARFAEAEPEDPEPVAQPSELPPISTPDGELAGYNVLVADDGPPRPKKRVVAQAVDDDPAPEPTAPDEPRPKKRKRKPKPKGRPSEPERAWTDEDDDRTPYAMNPADGLEPEREKLPDELRQPRADEMALLDRRDAPKPPKRVWSAEVLAFLAQSGTVSALLVLSAVGGFAGVMVRVARAFDPTAGGE